MLTPYYLADVPLPVVALYQELEDYILADISRRIAKAGKITDTAAWQVMRAQEIGAGMDKIQKEVARINGMSSRAVSKIFDDSAVRSAKYDDAIYRRAGLDPPAFRQSPYMIKYMQAASEKTFGTLTNLTGSMGFAQEVGGRVTFGDIAKTYQSALDFAHLQVASGAADQRTATRQAIKKLADSGIRTVDYKTGWSNHLDVAVTRAVRTGVSQMAGELSLMRGREMGIYTMEITAHAGARPTHAVWQGRVVDTSGNDSRYLTLSDIGYGDVAGFKGANCRHDWFPFVPGASVPVYSARQLSRLDPDPIDYGGKVYTYYNATQRQRQIETAIRKTKREIVSYEAAGLSDDMAMAAAKLQRQKQLYMDFSDAANIRPKLDRTQVYGYNKSVAQKTVWAARKAGTPKTAKAPDTRLHVKLDYDIIKKTGRKQGVIPRGADITNVRVIAGQGTSTPLKAADKLTEQYGGGEAWEWQKKVGTVYSKYDRYEVHWYELNGEQFDVKLKGWKER